MFSGGTGASTLQVEDLFIQSFSFGITSYWPVHVDDTRIHNCFVGFAIDNAGAATRGTLNRVSIKGSGTSIAFAGLEVHQNATLAVRDSVITGNESGVVMSFNAVEALLENTMVVHNGIFGIDARTGTVRLSNCMITGNVIGVHADTGASIVSWGNNRLLGNSSNNIWLTGTGTFTTVLAD